MANGLGPPPIQDPQGSARWIGWFQKINDFINRSSNTATWSDIDFTGSSITDIVDRQHNDLQSIQGGGATERFHLTNSQHTALTTSVNADAQHNHNVGPGVRFGITNTSASTYNSTTADSYIEVDASGANATVNLYTVSGNAGRPLVVKKGDSSVNTVTLDGSGSETIDGAATQVLTVQWESLFILATSAGWRIISKV